MFYDKEEIRMYDKDTKLVVVGLGYVGLPLAVAFSERLCVIGFDKNEEKVHALKNGIDDTNEVGSETLKGCDVIFTSDETDIKGADIYIVSVPTPIKSDKSPDLHPLISASICIGEALEPGALVIYESTVYPGLTEKVCIPLLEKHSKCKLNDTLWVGYSPERINPGDKVHTLSSIVKVVSGSTPEVCERVALLYQCIVEAGVHKVSSIKAAEAVKVCENSQRDINIAFMNELAMSLERMDICTLEVVEAMNTKWNALGFYPGLVGGHCISVDPYYYLHEAARLRSEERRVGKEC